MKLITLKLDRIEVWGFHGTEAVEKEKGGPFELTIELQCATPNDPMEDTLESRVDYAAVSSRALALFEEKPFDLIEVLAEHLAFILLQEFDLIHEIGIQIRKLKPVMDTKLHSVVVELQRVRSVS
ncbi:MAG: dihydroneopterin aldolase [Candidatus Lindowbacteria bacterium]|nr:dihydroneopterin aldolase [Candidatus Lindowbacteria bacterium]